jgi:hypothetical protein
VKAFSSGEDDVKAGCEGHSIALKDAIQVVAMCIYVCSDSCSK